MIIHFIGLQVECSSTIEMIMLEKVEVNEIKMKEEVDDESINEEAREWPQILAIVLGCISALNSGLLLSWTSPFIPKITEDEVNYDITKNQASYFTALNMAAMGLFSPFTLTIADSIGRKKAILLTAVPHSASWIIKATCTNLYAIYAARFLEGCGDALQFSSLPIYMGEIATPRVRGVWGCNITCSMYLGQFLINVIGAYLGVKESAYVCLIIPVVFVFSFSFMPESPYYYIIKGRDEDAKQSLRRLRRINNVDKEFTQLQVSIKRQMSESSTWKDLVMIRNNRRALIAGIFLRVAQLYSGMFAFAAYNQTIFEKAGGSVTPAVASMIYMGVCFVVNSAAALLSNRLGRRRSYVISSTLCSIVLLLEAIYFYLDMYQPSVDLSYLSCFPLAAMMAFLLFCSIGISLLPTLMLGELFSVNVKSKGVCVVTSIFGFMTVVTNLLFYYFDSYVGLCGPFFLFSGCTLLSAILVNILVPETKGKTLEEIQDILRSVR